MTAPDDVTGEHARLTRRLAVAEARANFWQAQYRLATRSIGDTDETRKHLAAARDAKARLRDLGEEP